MLINSSTELNKMKHDGIATEQCHRRPSCEAASGHRVKDSADSWLIVFYHVSSVDKYIINVPR